LLWVNLGLMSLVAALAIGLVSVIRPQTASIGRIFTTLGLQLAGVLIVTWFLVERGQSLAVTLPPPPEAEAAILAQVRGPTLASLLLILLAAVWGTFAGTAAAALVAWSRRGWLDLLVGAGSLIWIIPTFLIAILAQDLQAVIYNFSGVNTSGGYAQFSTGELVWSAAVLAIRPAAYAFRQANVLIADQARADYVRTAFAKGLRWRQIVVRHIVRPAAAGLVQTSASSIRLMFGSLPLVEFFFGYPGLGHLLLQSLGVSSGADTQGADPGLAIASAVVLASMLAVIEALTRISVQQLDPRLAEVAA
jgi:ABC-type dipeptide/oligopeptide/nickel transport system permease component